MKAVRGICFALGALIGGWLFFAYGPQALTQIYGFFRLVKPEDTAQDPIMVATVTLLGAALGAGGVGTLVSRMIYSVVSGWDRMHPGDKINIFIGIFFGIITTVPFVVLFSQQGAFLAALLSFGLMGFITAVVIYALKSIDDLLPWSKNRGKGRRSGVKVLDTNILIDGRIFDVIKAGFMDGPVYIPGFVLEELQLIADHQDSLKRTRGKRGLEMLNRLRSEFQVDVGSMDRFAPPEKENGKESVDPRLVRLARAIGADLVTNDHNLNRVAMLQEVKVLNLNELALALRPDVLPGEILNIMVFKDGSQMGQGVGYLDDGTMVVIEGGRKYVGQVVGVTVTQVHQTERGKMIFADAPDLESDEEHYRPRRRPAR